MARDCFDDLTGPLPSPYERERAGHALAVLEAAGVRPDPIARELLVAAFGNSPFLVRLARREAEFLSGLLAHGPHAALADITAGARSVDSRATGAEVMAELRSAKRRAALAIGLADIAGLWSVDEVTLALSEFADACLSGALRFLLREAAAKAGLPEDDPAALEGTTGLVALAMGKYGAHELNYSSDVDLVMFYDTERFPFRKDGDMRGAAVDLVRGLVRLLGETTADGYVFRVDLRLRPDAGATQIAISTEAAELYYESMGQNWERAAMIKARAAAGDREAGMAFLAAIEPFIWRKSLDFAAIEDIHSIKRQIHASRGHGKIAVAGHNLKLGRGGIREIEFFAQTQQLIAGGRNPALRARGTLAALAALRRRGLIADAAAADLSEVYRYLRRLEHRLQMIDDEQTHTIPGHRDGLAHVACFAGYAGTRDFEHALRVRLETVQRHYSRLFEREAPLADERGSLVFTGVEDDPETVATLAGMGFSRPRDVAATIRGWHHGRIRATRSARSREILTKLMPALLDALARTADPDLAFAQFDRFLAGLPAGVQVFSLLLANPHLLRLVAEIAGTAPRIAEYLGRNPAVLDALLDEGFLTELPQARELEEKLTAQLAAAEDYEAALDAVRRFAKEEMFRIGVQVIRGTADAGRAGPAYARIAEAAISGLLPVVEAEVARAHGKLPGGALCVLALGKLGGREMTAASDLDLIFVYDHASDAAQSDGARPLAPMQYFARFAQRMIAALTTFTAEGRLYDVDMRLRPSGNKGPIAVALESFARYHAEDAWTWERLALTRARVVAGPGALAARVREVIRAALFATGDPKKLRREAREMRDRLAAQFPGRSPWDLKFAPGGLVDIEFVTQVLQIEWAQRADVLDQNTAEALARLKAAGALAGGDADTLMAAAGLLHALTQVLRIALDGPFDPDSAPQALRNLLAGAAGVRDFGEADRRLRASEAAARAVLERILPA